MNLIVCSYLIVFFPCLFISGILFGNLLKNHEVCTFEFQFVAKGFELRGTFESIVNRGKNVKKEELHFKAKVKDMEPNHENKEKAEVGLKLMTKSMEKEKSKHKEDKGEKHKENDKEKHEDSEI
ncbi:hypothetical protein PVK06_022583 [Gossypium arboreum]|uniref:Uncharacterized protein n=1 Tax=Gossypium arboreum TaxID=29729 RepID=A0ABR0P8T3_GOSAR|nr:hypothetical protein PVK06_022583 [Gossypium arboreum]